MASIAGVTSGRNFEGGVMLADKGDDERAGNRPVNNS